MEKKLKALFCGHLSSNLYKINLTNNIDIIRNAENFSLIQMKKLHL